MLLLKYRSVNSYLFVVLLICYAYGTTDFINPIKIKCPHAVHSVVTMPF